MGKPYCFVLFFESKIFFKCNTSHCCSVVESPHASLVPLFTHTYIVVIYKCLYYHNFVFSSSYTCQSLYIGLNVHASAWPGCSQSTPPNSLWGHGIIIAQWFQSSKSCLLFHFTCGGVSKEVFLKFI